ncbi:hypothetical protein [Glycomyces algeriensis]|uniref:hypothetical protein n=1 Tax=Glycomyces algeriensis TaxID=256037 RepID=UPI0022D2E277|nr:hypothetical protein [Glycomyces algeriensis]MDA1365860.1 hypothetical protein [Glycomyces algeriensis]MDR7349375.1 hypothetical protein [Glycomyces algeriensis]
MLSVEELGDPQAVKGWELLCAIDPVFFRLTFEDGSDFEVRMNPGDETKAFELAEYTGVLLPGTRPSTSVS